jgi:hypothetical protein
MYRALKPSSDLFVSSLRQFRHVESSRVSESVRKLVTLDALSLSRWLVGVAFEFGRPFDEGKFVLSNKKNCVLKIVKDVRVL